MIKTSDFIVDFLIKKGIDTVFSVSGGASAHLLDSFNKQRSKIKFVAMYHEQACAMAADGYYRTAKKPACVLVTNGPGATNAITGVLGAFQDSIPMFVISGQVPTHQMMANLENPNLKLRQLGVQECDILSMVKGITKHTIIIDHECVNYQMSEAWFKMMDARKGPVWVEVPLDEQNKYIQEPKLDYEFYSEEKYDEIDPKKIVDLINNSKKPLIIAGNGIHLAGAEAFFDFFILTSNIPVVTTWNAKDLMYYNDKEFVGSFGILGERAGNIAVQSADLILILGSRLSIPCIGYDHGKFAPKAVKIYVDIDKNELNKPTTQHFQHKIHAKLEDFLDVLSSIKWEKNLEHIKWRDKLTGLKYKYPVYKKIDHYRLDDFINSFFFIEKLSSILNLGIISNVVTDMGTAFTCTMQAFKLHGNVKLFTSSGTSSMGYGLPGAIGAWFGNPGRPIVLITGDGGFQMNIQELQTIKKHSIPIKIFLLDNNGYSAISLMQDNLFNRNYIGSTEKDVPSPEFTSIARCYKMNVRSTGCSDFLDRDIRDTLDEASKSVLHVINIPPNQPLYPRVMTRKDTEGKIISNSLEHMYPYLSDEELKEAMS